MNVAMAVLGLLGRLNYRSSFTLRDGARRIARSVRDFTAAHCVPGDQRCAIWLAVRNKRIGLAALMASTSLVFSQLSAIFFTIVVTIFGI
jgi:hypothetical protein